MAISLKNQDTKQPYEEWATDVSFSHTSGAFDLPPGSNEIVSSVASAVKWHRQDPTNKSDATLEILLSSTPVIVNPGKTKVRVYIRGGTDNYDYQITVRAVFDNGAKLEEELLIRVREE